MKIINLRINKNIYAVWTLVLSVLMLTACGVETVNTPSAETPAFETVKTEEQIRISELTAKENNEGLNRDEYNELAELYRAEGLLRKYRNTLERCYRLYSDEEALAILEGLYINLNEEEESVRDVAGYLRQYMGEEETLNEAIHLAEDAAWFKKMMPRLMEGFRNYFLVNGDGENFVVRTGYEDGTRFVSSWLIDESNKITAMRYHNGTVEVMSTIIKDGRYEGEFTYWMLEGNTGNIIKESGTFVSDEYAGEYALDIYEGDSAGDPFDMWNNRENVDYASYTVNIEDGNIEGMTKFATSMDKIPSFDAYEAVEDDSDISDEIANEIPEIRIVDGEVQWLYNSQWVVLGSVDSYRQKDPFWAYEEAHNTIESPISPGKTGIDIDGIKASLKPDTAAKPAATVKPAATPTKPAATPTKPAVSTPKPTVAPKPTPAPKPAPAPEPTPAPPSDDDDSGNDDGGSSDSGDSDSGGNDSGGSDSGDSGDSDSGGSDSGDSDGSDGELDWTPDIM